MMLKLEGVSGGYGGALVLRNLCFEAKAGEVTCIMGRNGVGKTTLMCAIMGLVRAEKGSVRLDKLELSNLPAHEVPRHGIGYVPQGRRLFGPLTVAENLEIGLMTRGKRAATRDHVLTLFPRLRERLGQTASTLSGGEQQMLAIARALCLEPKVLLLDEPTEGLQPSMIAAIREVVLGLKATGVGIILVEQRVEAVLGMADRVAFMDHGHVAETVARVDLAPDAPQFKQFVGV
jgi:branched-chain amino acid transport system ATP-binding protein